jgi:O6-methylguanine-DNA--protein-cysteine methyltransferase
MARPLRIPFQELTPGQAQYVLGKLLAERLVSPAEVTSYLRNLGQEIADLERRIAELRAASGGASPAAEAPRRRRRGRPPRVKAVAESTPTPVSAPARQPARKRRRRAKITPEQVASRQLQGRYLGLIRQVPSSKRGKYQEIAKEKGREAAIKALRDALGK